MAESGISEDMMDIKLRAIFFICVMFVLLVFKMDASFRARGVRSRVGVEGEFNQNKTADIITVKNWNESANYDYFFFPQWFWYTNSLFEHDELGDLDLRSTLGTGIGYQFFKSDPSPEARADYDSSLLVLIGYEFKN